MYMHFTQLVMVNHAVNPPAPATTTTQPSSSSTMILVLLVLAAALAMAAVRLLRRMFGVVSTLVGSVGAALGGLFMVLLVGSILVAAGVLLMATG